MAQHPHQGILHRESVSSSTNYTYYNRKFDDITDLFIFACTNGDYILVHRLLEEGEVEADVSNKMGKSALQLSIENEHFEVVKILLDAIPYEQFRDALLLAIYMDHINIANYIMHHETYRTFSGGFLEPTDPQAYDDSQFSSDITPLILAAQYNRLSTVHYLLSKGEHIKKPHVHMCTCVECVENSASDSFRQAQIRLSAYKGLSSEVYIALAYPDPILQAFELGHELRQLAKVEHYFYKDYKKLANQLSKFVARLLDNVRGHEELEIVLNKTGLPHEEKYASLARFDLAIQYKEKPFVSHSSCQQKLMERWYADLSVIKNSHLFKRVIFYLGYIMCLPFLLLAYYIYPKSKMSSLCRQPNLKLKAYIASYFTFLASIIVSSYFSTIYLRKTEFLSNYNSTIYTNYIQFIYRNTELRNGIIGISRNETNNTIDSVVNCDISLRSMQPNPFEIIISIWVIGYFWNIFKQIASLGLHAYLKVPSNYVDCSMNILYTGYFIFLYSSIIYTRIAMNTLQSSDYWTNIARYDTMSDTEKKYYIYTTRHLLYRLNADRFYWNSGDLQNLAEAFFAMGNVASICRICFLLPTIPFVGPLQVMLNRMMIDIAKWIFIILIFFISFACSLFLIFSYFSVVVQQQNTLLQASSSISSSTSTSVMDYNCTTTTNAKCPSYFYELLNQSIPLITDSTDYDYSDYSDDNTDFCQQSSNNSTYKPVGPYPAIYFFGQSFEATLLTTFFTLFNFIGNSTPPTQSMFTDRGYELITLTRYKPDPNTYRPGFDAFTSNLGFIIYGIFTFICVTVLINTLIAMLERTIEQIDDRADVEWKFARSQLYMEYIRDGNTVPVPLNIIPSPKSILKFFKRIKQMIALKKFSWSHENKNSVKNEDRYSIHLNLTRGINHNTESDGFKNQTIFKRKQSHVSSESLTYKIVIERVVKRFLLYYKDPRINLNDAKNISELKEIRNDVSSFRSEISNGIDEIDDMRASLTQSMSKFNEKLNGCFDLKQIQQHLNNQKPL